MWTELTQDRLKVMYNKKMLKREYKNFENIENTENKIRNIEEEEHWEGRTLRKPKPKWKSMWKQMKRESRAQRREFSWKRI